MNATDYNCWIKEDGTSNRVPSGLHLCCIEPDDCIRVSMPERRRTWVGIDVYPNATPEAKTACISLIRSIRREGLQIRAHIDDTTIEVLPHQRPTTLNKALACIPSPSI